MSSVISTAEEERPEIFELPTAGEATNIHIIDPLSDSHWEDLIERHPKASVFHQRGWLEALTRTYKYKPLVLTTSRPAGPLNGGMLVCEVKSWLTGSRAVSLPFSDHCEPLFDSNADLMSLIDQAQPELQRRGWRYLELRPTDESFAEIERGLGFQISGRYVRHVLDLDSGIDELFRSFHKDSVQRRIKHANRSGLIELCGTSPEMLEQFYKLFVLTRSRHHLPPPPFAWFKNLVACLGSALEIRIAYKDNSPIAGVIILRFRETAYFKYGCSDARFNRFGATSWLLWNAIQAAKASGAVRFDFGRTQTDNPGLIRFKNHWVSRSAPLTYWRYPASTSKYEGSDWKLKTAKRLFSHLPTRLLVLSGKLIYPHVG